ncbi:RNA-binding protein [Priestia megaterium]|uniref:YlmH family RNA-binding protein n=1 Tax=Priestia megaterium TaxID=1404 RepID=UPI003BA1FF82
MSIYEHFRQEEHGFIDQVLQWKEDVLHQYSPKLTDFLDPREQQIVTAIVGTEGEVQVSFDGGQPFAERKRALLYPDYYVPESEDFQLHMYELNYPKKFVTIEHPQVLGSAMSLGLRRSKFGDILVAGDDIQLVAAEEISSYIEMNLTSIGKAKVSLSSIQREQLHVVKEEMTEHVYTVSSMRLDVLLSTIHNLSRQKVQLFIANGAVKVNFKVIEQPSFECHEGDILSLRGHGRSRIVSLEGKTKKEKWRIVVGKQK